MMPGDKPFKTKYLSAQLGCSRLSFADAGHMEEYLHTIPGSVSALELLFDVQGKVQLVIDRPCWPATPSAATRASPPPPCA